MPKQWLAMAVIVRLSAGEGLRVSTWDSWELYNNQCTKHHSMRTMPN